MAPTPSRAQRVRSPADNSPRRGNALADLLDKASKEADVRQRHVAEGSGISTRTLNQIKAGKKLKLRPNVLLRLAAYFCDDSPEDAKKWFEAAGVQVPTNDSIYQGLRKLQLKATRSSAAAAEFLGSVLKKLTGKENENRHALCAYIYTSAPSRATSDEVRGMLKALFDTGRFSLAQVIPYGEPRTADPQFRSKYKPLIDYIEHIYAYVEYLCEDFRKDIKYATERARIYLPNQREFFMDRPTMMTRSRPVFVEFYDPTANDESDKLAYQFGQYSHRFGAQDLHFERAPTAGTDFRQAAWRAYLEDIVDSWERRPEHGLSFQLSSDSRWWHYPLTGAERGILGAGHQATAFITDQHSMERLSEEVRRLREQLERAVAPHVGSPAGQAAPASGQYREHGSRRRKGRDVTVTKGEQMPPTTQKGGTYKVTGRTDSRSGKRTRK